MDTELLEVSPSSFGRTYPNSESSELQVITVKTTIHKPANISSIYILPHDPINDKKLDKLIKNS